MLTIPVDRITPGLAKEIGKAIYNNKIKDTLGPEHKGKIVVIDIYSGDYEIGDTDPEANMRLFERRPDAHTWAERVGYPTVYVMKSPRDLPPAPFRFDDHENTTWERGENARIPRRRTTMGEITLTIPVEKITPGMAEEIGVAIYKDKIKDTLGPEHKGKIVVIDIYSGDYEIGDTDSETTMRLRERRPDAQTWAEKVGYPAVYVMKSPRDIPPSPTRYPIR